MTTALAPIAAIDRIPLLFMLFPFLLYLNISHTEWKVIPLCTNDFQTILTRAIANPLTAQYHSRTGSMARRGGVSALEAADYGPEVAAEQPLVCLVDDEQRLNRASAQVLGFVARR